jgi:4-carboxymuconolactone decarboxylase
MRSASSNRTSWGPTSAPELTYKKAIAAFGQHVAAELSYLVGLYALVSITLNTFDVPVPEA